MHYAGEFNSIIDAWLRIKTALAESQKTPANNARDEICPITAMQGVCDICKAVAEAAHNAAIESAEALKPSHNSAMEAILQLESDYRDCEDAGSLAGAIESAIAAAKQHQ